MLLECLVIQHLNLAGSSLRFLWLNAGLFSDELRQALQVSSSIVILRLVTLSIEELNRWESLNAKSLSKGLLGIRIDLCDRNLIFGKFEILCKLLVDWRKVLAVATPRCKELDESRLASNGDLVEVIRDQVEDR